MRKIVYYVAVSLDGYISGPNEDISGFVREGNGVARYLTDLADYDTVIMGKNTYEFGYKFGLKPGLPAYPHMTHHIFSSSLTFENPHPKVHVRPVEMNEVNKIRNQDGTDIYLCGGGQFAGWLLDHHCIDVLKIKLNPLLLGSGVKLFGDSQTALRLELTNSERYENGLQIMTYKVR
ncbi:MAG: dihydrofolate reductase family protein [Bacteroidetes bacterium]|nr:dihydrofolate reductase family protein [Bacteroidota bacterium]